MKKILIIEDHATVAQALRIRLEANGYEATITPDAIQGCHAAVRDQPDLILLDVTLPGGNGLDLAKKFRTLPECKNIPVILVTASKKPELRKQAMQLGVAGLLEKPYDPEELLAAAEMALSKWNSNTQIQARKTAEASTPAPNGDKPSESGSKKILIIEDDERIAKALSLRLKGAGYETSVAHDAISGVSRAAEFQPNLTLLDISMPAGNGFQAAERIQSILPDQTPIIFLTASKKPEFQKRAEAMGAAGYFEKPFSSEPLLASIRDSLSEPA